MNKKPLNLIKDSFQKFKKPKHKKYTARQVLTTMVGVTAAIGTLASALANTSITAQAAGVTYEYTGSNQDYVIPATGWYKLEAWGGSGTKFSSAHRW